MAQIRPAFDFIVANADQMLLTTAQHIAEGHHFGAAGTAQ